MAEAADVLIVGGGVIGLTLARELLAAGRENVVVLEKEPSLGRHASGRNSGVLHAGIYYAPDSLKARSCLRGNMLMRAYCRERGLPLVECGKVIVARDAAELPTLDELHRRALANGARVEFVDERQLADLEPSARTVEKALLSRDTAVVDPKAVLESLRQELTGSGRVRILTGRAFTGLAGPRTAATSGGPIAYARLVNAAGAHCDRVARHFGVGEGYRLIPFKGIYRKLRPGASFPVNGNIYPVPDIRNPFLGVHFTRSVHGEVYVGPTAIPAFGRENYGFFGGMDREALAIVGADARLFFANPRFRGVALTEPRKYVPAFFHRDAARLVKRFDPALFERAAKVGIRPQLVDWRTKELVMDFVVAARDETVHVLNPISPAFTSSMDLARTVVQQHLRA
ncbi:L-2-hydroxyglutarate oxidase [Anaeromyxobacter diazotrophicus]|uniref:Aminobutyraldehyde dehydrogenase n=1 Tax=Anaeromyxobacter diazotrophicus TaxID=2590199 RepID=A0A7I9VQX4_9BACT|nr:L-2-hydroxyglutarate oxidase [Anaeromyxobacter diazotrophicus]GEJ58520.1 aminobutyraldehyde dehydrogenase [Anaeromyxobacter diazotrophicus]